MDPAAPTPEAAAHPDPLTLLRQCETSAIEREGVAMFVGIHDARTSATRPEPVAHPEAGRLTELYETYAEALAAGRDDRRPVPDPTGGGWSLIEVLVVMSEHHLRAPVGLTHPDRVP